jgi:hypothetical protein
VKPESDQLIEGSASSSVERLLLAAAEYEPETPPPGFLSSGGVLTLLAEDAQRRRTRTVRARVAALTGMMAGAAACSASLVMALTQAQRPDRSTAPAGAAAVPAPLLTKVASAAPERAAAKATPPPSSRPRRTMRRRRPRRQPVAAPEAAPTPAVWTEQTVEHQVSGLLADAWIVEPQPDGALELIPVIVDLPTGPSAPVDACGLVDAEAPPEPPAERDAPATPAEEPR